MGAVVPAPAVGAPVAGAAAAPVAPVAGAGPGSLLSSLFRSVWLKAGPVAQATSAAAKMEGWSRMVGPFERRSVSLVAERYFRYGRGQPGLYRAHSVAILQFT